MMFLSELNISLQQKPKLMSSDTWDFGFDNKPKPETQASCMPNPKPEFGKSRVLATRYLAMPLLSVDHNNGATDTDGWCIVR